ncbi:MAG: YlmC/YmxH family sporulation protein [Clostridiales bacterium]|nr:YlmC/YmxH family sporulation protein [Clostridiales bacterium]
MWRFGELRRKEVINIRDGVRLGYVYDLEIDPVEGRLVGIVVPGPRTLFGLLGSREEYIIDWDEIEKIGEDIILVSVQMPEQRFGAPARSGRTRSKRFSV